MTVRELIDHTRDFPDTPLMPVLFVGHGSPMNGIENNVFTDAWTRMGTELPRPHAILAISAHWLTDGTYVHIKKSPETIHDFWGFPEELYGMTYPCPGTPEYAHLTKKYISLLSVQEDSEWGIDHGSWIVLSRMYPKADIPVFQMSINFSQGARFHYDLGSELRALRTKGVLIMGSGNIIHNLGHIAFEDDAPTFDWAMRFDALTKDLITSRHDDQLISYEKLGHDAHLAIPTPDHYYPLLYTLGASLPNEKVSFPVEGIAHGSIAMRSIIFGETKKT